METLTPQITIDLTELPETGFAQMVFRCRQSDRDTIHRAAKLMGMATSAFTRLILIRASEELLRETGLKKVEITPGGHEPVKISSDVPPGMRKV